MNALAELSADIPDRSIQVLIADPHPLTRIGLGVLLHRQRWVGRCVLASSRDEGAVLAARQRLDVAVVDVSGAGPFVGSYLAPLRAARPAMPLVLSSHYLPPKQAQMLAAGGAGLLTPELSAEEVVRSVRAAAIGDEPPAPMALSRAADDLSEREREVLALLCTGATNREIAAAMQVGTETVKKHAGALYRKLGVRNRTQAVQRAANLLVV